MIEAGAICQSLCYIPLLCGFHGQSFSCPSQRPPENDTWPQKRLIHLLVPWKATEDKGAGGPCLPFTDDWYGWGDKGVLCCLASGPFAPTGLCWDVSQLEVRLEFQSGTSYALSSHDTLFNTLLPGMWGPPVFWSLISYFFSLPPSGLPHRGTFKETTLPGDFKLYPEAQLEGSRLPKHRAVLRIQPSGNMSKPHSEVLALEVSGEAEDIWVHHLRASERKTLIITKLMQCLMHGLMQCLVHGSKLFVYMTKLILTMDG